MGNLKLPILILYNGESINQQNFHTHVFIINTTLSAVTYTFCIVYLKFCLINLIY